VVDKTEELAQALAESERNRQLAGSLAEELAEARSVGESHSIKNRLQSILNDQEKRYAHLISEMVSTIFKISQLPPKGFEEGLRYFQEACVSFGLNPQDLNNKKKLEDVLRSVEIINLGNNESAVDPAVKALFGSISLDRIKLDQAYAKFKQTQEKYRSEIPDNPLLNLDPFVLLYSLREIQEGVSLAKERMSRLGKLESVKEVSFSTALREALELARQDKKQKLEQSPLDLTEEINYDPTFTTIPGLCVFMLRDLFYNVIDANSKKANVLTLDPSQFRREKLPYEQQFNFRTYPLLYVCVENEIPGLDGQNVSDWEKISGQLNDYLRSELDEENMISSKNKGGQGTYYLKKFSRLHQGQGYYEVSLERKSMLLHLYFEKLSM